MSGDKVWAPWWFDLMRIKLISFIFVYSEMYSAFEISYIYRQSDKLYVDRSTGSLTDRERFLGQKPQNNKPVIDE